MGDAERAATEGAGIAALRAEWLEHLEGDVLPITHLDTLISETSLAATTSEKQAIAMDLIKSELGEKNILVGGVVGGDPAFIEPWSGPDEAILDRIKANYVDEYDDPAAWVFNTWFSLNDERRVFQPDNPDRS